ncbi:NarK family nitrate/nitrite MFS transporter [Chroococcidiopsis sp. FACHB-1243]|uniref:NarK family nitrate/nitrite MFS transporter n=1 Tax=Chroococcidiopsis sp. [FACHB-1243] TaxID=2692781 RepID=UPI00177BEB96|nr:NarK family nitrate/nitrite MFS transporter [Chroococcidiopsis sp. [FACHB-1243]]MBD2309677.1 NarK family nitrate/nitrite MFS transporter [Chroococcidiopsis sp. [FACHB-1243]]
MLPALFSFRDRYRILHLNWFARFLSFVVWFSLAPFATTIQHELHLSLPQLKVLAICNLALTIPARIAIGMVLDRYGPRLTFSALLVFAIVPCLLSATARDFHQLVWSSLINGIMGAGFVAGVRMVAEWFPSKEIGLAQGIYGGWGNFGAAAAQFCLPLLAVAIAYFTGGTLNWRMAIAAIGFVTPVYGSLYFRYTQDTPPGKVYQRPKRHGGLEVTSGCSFWAMTLLDLGLLVSLGLLTYPLAQNNVRFLTWVQVGFIWFFLGLLYLFQFYRAWQVNREIVGSLNPFSSEFLQPSQHYPLNQRYQMRQIALLDFTYLTNSGSQITVLSILPTWFEQTFGLNPVVASLVATAYPVLNLVSRPSGGWISDRTGSRKWTTTGLTLGISIGYLLMGKLDDRSNLTVAVGVTMFCAYFVQAGAGATFSIVPLIRKSATGQIAGSVGAYGNVGGVVYLLIYSLSNAQTLFYSMGVTALICASLCAFFLKEPPSSVVTNSPETAVASPKHPS